MFELFRRRNRRQFVIDSIPPDAVCAEIGVWKADFSEVIARAAQPRELHLIDPWLFRTNFPRRWYGGARAASQQDMDIIHDTVRKRMAQYRGVQVHRLLSVEAARVFPDLYFDWIYVDGDHSHNAVAADLEAYWGKLKFGGILAADDYRWRDESGDRSVKRALDTFAQSNGLRPTVRDGQFLAVKSAAWRQTP